MKRHGRIRWARPGAALAALLTAVFATGCVHYQVAIDVSSDRRVVVRERMVPDQDWRQEAGDSTGATDNLLDEYVEEAVARGGEAKRYGRDSATAVFRYPSLERFVHDWPDTADNHSFWDRSLLRRASVNGKDCDELVLFRMSPPDPSKALPNQRFPVLSFVIHLPAEAETTNAHGARGREYAWRFSQAMTRVDSVWVVWPRAGTN